MDYTEVASSIEAELRARSAPQRAEGEKRYLKSDLVHLGVPLGEIERISRRHAGKLTRRDTLGLARELWREPIHERRAAAVQVLERNAGALEPDDVGFLLDLIRGSRTWALVDPLAVNVLGTLVERDRELTLDGWVEDRDFWVRRAALLSQLRYVKKGGDLDTFFGYADALLEEKGFFIRKAIGWVLREVAKSRPDEVYVWLAPRVQRASGVTMREAVKYLDEARRDELMERYRASRKRTTSRRSSPSASR